MNILCDEKFYLLHCNIICLQFSAAGNCQSEIYCDAILVNVKIKKKKKVHESIDNLSGYKLRELNYYRLVVLMLIPTIVCNTQVRQSLLRIVFIVGINTISRSIAIACIYNSLYNYTL